MCAAGVQIARTACQAMVCVFVCLVAQSCANPWLLCLRVWRSMQSNGLCACAHVAGGQANGAVQEPTAPLVCVCVRLVVHRRNLKPNLILCVCMCEHLRAAGRQASFVLF